MGGLNEKVSEPLLWELFLQAGPVVNTNITERDSVTGQRQGYSFVEFLSEKNADSAIKIMNMIKLYGKPTGVNKASSSQQKSGCGSPAFSLGTWTQRLVKVAFMIHLAPLGVILQTPKIMQDPDTGSSQRLCLY